MAKLKRDETKWGGGMFVCMVIKTPERVMVINFSSFPVWDGCMFAQDRHGLHGGMGS